MFQQIEQYALRRCSICCKNKSVIASTPWISPDLISFCQNLSLCGSDEIIIMGIPTFSASLFIFLKEDKHYKVFILTLSHDPLLLSNIQNQFTGPLKPVFYGSHRLIIVCILSFYHLFSWFK